MTIKARGGTLLLRGHGMEATQNIRMKKTTLPRTVVAMALCGAQRGRKRPRALRAGS